MSRPSIFYTFSQALGRLFSGASERRGRRALRRSRTSARFRLECLESRVLLTSYIIEDLGTLGGNSSQANAINAEGDVVGSSQLSATLFTDAVLWAPGKPAQDLGGLGGFTSSATAINDLGEIVGGAEIGFSSTSSPFVLQPGGTMTSLSSLLPPSFATNGNSLLTATGVNDTGDIVGQAHFNLIDPTPNTAYSFIPTSPPTVNDAFAGIAGQATAVSGTTTVATLVPSANKSEAAVQNINTPNAVTVLPAVPLQVSSEVWGISAPNSSGTQFAVGDALLTNGLRDIVEWTIPTNLSGATAVDLSRIIGSSINGSGLGVNAAGDVVGAGVDEGSGKADAFVDLGGPLVSLNSLLPAGSGVWLTSATGINDAGQICANGTIDGQSHAFLLQPFDSGPPHAKLTSAPDINAAGATTYSFSVTYTDATGIDPTTLGNGEIQVTGPGFSQTANLTSTSGPANELAAVYTITAPGGAWSFSADGTYTITLNGGLVRNVSGEPLSGGTLGHFFTEINVVRASVSGTAFKDVNNDGKLDPGDPGVANTDIFIDLNGDGHLDAGDPISTTDANGNYSFGGVLPGTYSIREAAIESQLVTSPAGGVLTVTLSAGENLTGQNFGNMATPVVLGVNGQLPTGNFQVETAQLGQPATTLLIAGVNFTANDIFYFGNDQAAASPTNLQTLTSGSQSFNLQVPALATTGALVVFDPLSARYKKLPPTVTVNSYRNVDGFSFDNPGKNPDGGTDKNFSFTELTDVYGAGQTMIDLGLGTVHNPLASAELAVINALLPPSNGLCVGYSVASSRLSLGLAPPYDVSALPESIAGYPATATGQDTATSVWQLANSDPLHEAIRLAHLEQGSSEVIGNYIAQVAADEFDGASNLIGVVESQLAQGLPCPVSFFHVKGQTFDGHCVLAYNVQNNPNGSVTLDVYDPDLPFDGPEAGNEDNAGPSPTVPGVEDGTNHAKAFAGSTITFGTDNHWSYNGGAGAASGGMASIAAAPLSVFDVPQDLLSIDLFFDLVAFAVVGGANETQVTDSAGHTLLNADGSPNSNPSTMIPNAARYVGGLNSPPLDAVQGTGNFMQTITGTASGTYTAASFGPTAMAMISGMATASGQVDQFGLNSSNDTLTFIPGANKELNADLITSAADGSLRQAQLSSTASSGAAQTLQFQGDHVLYHDAGGAGSFSFVLTPATTDPTQTFTTGRMSLAAGDSVDILPSSWTNLQTATATVVVTHANGSKTTSTVANGGQGIQVNAVEGVSFSAAVSSFTNQAAAGKTAVIDWGDDTTSTGTVTASGANVSVSGSHTYAVEGYYPTSVTLSDATGPLAQASGEATVAFNSFGVAFSSVTASAGVPFSGTLTTMTESSLGEDASDFAVSINWGDGATSAGTLLTTSTAGQFLVQGAHTWTTTGTYSVSVTVTLVGSAAAAGQTLTIGSNTNFSGTVAQFNLPIPGSATSNYIATINWGDYTTSTGTLTLQSNGSVILSGSHSYAIGNQSFATSYTLTGGPSSSAPTSAVVSPAVGTITGTVFDDLNGNGILDAGEAGLQGQVVFLDENNDGKLDPGDPFVLTNSSGVYTFNNVPAGNIVVREIVPSGFRVDAPGAGSYPLTLSAGQALSGLNFADTQLALISGTVFLDSNDDGTKDPTDSGAANQIVYLDLSNTGVLTPNDPIAITDATGAFAFTVPPGSYLVRLQPSSDFTITTPAGGAYGVTVGDGGTNSGGLFGEYLSYALVTSVSPKVGPTTGGTAVSINGTFFTPTSTVKFGNLSASSVTFYSSTKLIAIVPPEGPGTVDVTVLTSAGPSPTSSADQYTYVSPPTVTGIAPASGPSSGGTSVTITGTNFTPSTSVLFGTVPASSVTFVSATDLTAVAPAGTADTTVNVTVTTTGGTSAASNADQYTYYGPFSKYLVSVVGSSTVLAGSSFAVTIQATDAAGTPVTNYSGPTSVTATIKPVVTASNFPLTVSLNSSGFGFFQGNVQKSGSYTISAAGGSFTGSTSTPVTITAAAPAKLAFATQPANTPTEDILPTVKVQILDAFGNLTSDSSDSVTLSVASGPGSFATGSSTTATAVNGLATFGNLVLIVPGSYTLGAVVPAKYVGPNSNAFAVQPLQVLVGSFAGTPSGFSLRFNAPYLVNSLTPVLYGSGFGAAAPVPSVTLTQTKDAVGNPVNNPVEGSLVLNAATNSLTFVATNTALEANNGSPVLPDGTYTAVLHSSAAGDGFQALNSGGGFLDGLDSGTPGSGDYTTTFLVSASPVHDDVLWVPATADGPGQALNAPGNNQVGGGYPVYLSDTTGTVTSVQVTLNYNPALLTVSGVTGAHFTLLGSSTPGQAILQYSGPALPAGSETPIGFLTAKVPGGAIGNPMPYKAKDLLHLSGASLNSGTIPVATSDALHLVAYVGDADGNGRYTSNDAVLITRTALQTDSGFTAYPLVDPVIVADTDGSGFIPADAALQVNEAGVAFPTTNLPSPPIPAGVVFQPIANNVDPTLSLPSTLPLAADGTVTVPVNLDDAHPAGSTGLIRADLALTYDPRQFTVSPTDIHLGSVPAAGSGWTLVPTIDPATGQIAIALSSNTPIADALSGSLVTIAFHALTPDLSPLTPFLLVASVNPNGQYFATELEDAQGTFTLTPAPTNVHSDPIEGTVVPPAVPSSAAVSGPMTFTEEASVAALTVGSFADVTGSPGEPELREQISISPVPELVDLAENAGAIMPDARTAAFAGLLTAVPVDGLMLEVSSALVILPSAVGQGALDLVFERWSYANAPDLVSPALARPLSLANAEHRDSWSWDQVDVSLEDAAGMNNECLDPP